MRNGAFRGILGAMKHRLLIAAVVFAAPSVIAADWPQWLGPNRDAVWPETGIVEKFPEGGLKELWRKPIGLGYGGPAMVGGKVYVMDYQKTGGKIDNNPGRRDKLEGKERVLCFDAKTGKIDWTHAYDRFYSLSYAAGPRCTPAVADGKVYALGAEGDLWCLDAEDGTVKWHKDLQKEYKTESGIWGFSGHPLVDGDTLFCLVGGKGSVAVALDKDTGKEKWRALESKEAGYCPPTMIGSGKDKQLLIWHPQALNGLDPTTGGVLWTYPLKPAYNMSCTAPRVFGNRLYVSGIGKVSAFLELKPGRKGVEEVWKDKGVFCSNSTPLFHGDTIYGCDVQSSALTAVNAKDGESLWESTLPTLGKGNKGRHGTAFMVRNGDRHFIFSETGDLILAKLSPKGYEEISRQHLLEPTNEAFGRPVVWSHPAFADKCVIARNDKEIVCVSLAK